MITSVKILLDKANKDLQLLNLFFSWLDDGVITKLVCDRYQSYRSKCDNCGVRPSTPICYILDNEYIAQNFKKWLYLQRETESYSNMFNHYNIYYFYGKENCKAPDWSKN